MIRPLMSKTLEKFATQVDSSVLGAVRAIAEKEGRQLQSVVGEALEALVEQRRLGKAKPINFTDAYKAGLKRYDGLYRKLAE